MNNRERQILKIVVNHYLENGESLGSRTIEKQYNIGVSSATIRNAMSDLESLGYITKTHSSSGRIPTKKGYQIYVDELLQIRELSFEAKSKIVEVFNKKINQIDSVLAETSRILSHISHYAGIVLEPIIKEDKIKKIEMVHLDEKKVFVVIVMNSNTIKTSNLYLKDNMKDYEIEEIKNYLNGRIRDSNGEFSIEDLKKFVTTFAHIEGGSVEYDMFKNSKIFMEGGVNLLEQNELDTLKVIDRAKILNDQDEIKQIFRGFIEDEKYETGEVNIVFGGDLDKPGFDDLSFVFSVYEIENEKGVIGVIGPTRMEYSKTVGLVDYVTDAVKQMIDKGKVSMKYEIMKIDEERIKNGR